MLIFVKLGGSLITDKRESQHFHPEVTRRAGQEIAAALAAKPDLKVLIGHGSGSFGHVAAQKHGTMNGVHTTEEWRGFAEVATVAHKLNRLVTETLAEAGLPVFSIQPSASARSEDGNLVAMETAPFSMALEHNLVPIVYGDVCFDSVRGGTIISTETVFFYLAERLYPDQIMLLGEVEGVYDDAGVVIPHISPANLDSVAASLGGSHGTDVTGGMASKVRGMVELGKRLPGMEIRIFGGTTPGQIESALVGNAKPGTLITG